MIPHALKLEWFQQHHQLENTVEQAWAICSSVKVSWTKCMTGKGPNNEAVASCQTPRDAVSYAEYILCIWSCIFWPIMKCPSFTLCVTRSSSNWNGCWKLQAWRPWPQETPCRTQQHICRHFKIMSKNTSSSGRSVLSHEESILKNFISNIRWTTFFSVLESDAFELTSYMYRLLIDEFN